MAFIPKAACWYLADIILEHVIDDDPRNVVHVNTHLIKANSPDEAYKKALAVGRSKRQRFRNTDGKTVRVAFRGLRELVVIHEPLEDGAEIAFEESIRVSPERLRRWSRAKASLAVFLPTQAKLNGPNYMPESVMKLLEEAGFQRTQLGFRFNRAVAPDRSRGVARAKGGTRRHGGVGDRRR